MKTDELPSEAEKEEQKAEASTNTNGKQQERRAFWEKGNSDVYRSGHLSSFPSVSHCIAVLLVFPFSQSSPLLLWTPVFARAGLFLEPKAV